MSVEFAFLCVYAEPIPGTDRLNAVGLGIRSLPLAKVPGPLPPCYLVVGGRGPISDAWLAPGQIQLTDVHGHVVASLPLPALVPQRRTSAAESDFRLLAPLRGLAVPAYGTYTLRLLYGDTVWWQVPVDVFSEAVAALPDGSVKGPGQPAAAAEPVVAEEPSWSEAEWESGLVDAVLEAQPRYSDDDDEQHERHA